jgi:hypothetical protein
MCILNGFVNVLVDLKSSLEEFLEICGNCNDLEAFDFFDTYFNSKFREVKD